MKKFLLKLVIIYLYIWKIAYFILKLGSYWVVLCGVSLFPISTIAQTLPFTISAGLTYYQDQSQSSLPHKIVFTSGSGTFVCKYPLLAQVLVVGGGGGGGGGYGSDGAGGGGAGGLAVTTNGNPLELLAGMSYTLTVGVGGSQGQAGAASSIMDGSRSFSVTANGGGFGGSGNNQKTGGSGGSGGGGDGYGGNHDGGNSQPGQSSSSLLVLKGNGGGVQGVKISTVVAAVGQVKLGQDVKVVTIVVVLGSIGTLLISGTRQGEVGDLDRIFALILG